VFGIFAVWLTVLRLILKNPNSTTSQLSHIRLSRTPDWITKTGSMRTLLLWNFLDEIMKFGQIVERETLSEADERHVVQKLEFGYRPRIEELLGTETLERYLEALKATSTSCSATVACQAVIPIVVHAAMAELEKAAREQALAQRRSMEFLEAINSKSDNLFTTLQTNLLAHLLSDGRSAHV
jgi:hypothetical protein